jgi:hypothetical protein
MSIETYQYLNYASIILGLMVIILCLYGDVPQTYSSLLLWMMPVLIIVNYYSLNWLAKKDYY